MLFHYLKFQVENVILDNYVNRMVFCFRIRSDHNTDNSSQILNKWLKTSGTNYHSVDVKIVDIPNKYDDESGPAHWPHSRFQHVVELRETALKTARDLWADYIWVY